jgi:hypothetical protein
MNTLKRVLLTVAIVLLLDAIAAAVIIFFN